MHSPALREQQKMLQPLTAITLAVLGQRVSRIWWERVLPPWRPTCSFFTADSWNQDVCITLALARELFEKNIWSRTSDCYEGNLRLSVKRVTEGWTQVYFYLMLYISIRRRWAQSITKQQLSTVYLKNTTRMILMCGYYVYEHMDTGHFH